MQEIWFLQSAHCLMLIAIFMKFRDNRLNGFQVIVPRDITVVSQELGFLNSACPRMLVDICMKIHEDTLKGFQVRDKTLLRRDLVMLNVPREITQKYKCKNYGFWTLHIL